MAKEILGKIFVLLGLFLLCPLAGSYAEEEKLEPDIQFEETIYDFGKVEQNEKIVRNYNFRNEGEKVLIISEVNSSCKCLNISLSSKEIAPGEAGWIKVIFDTGEYQGRIGRTISVYSNDPDKPEVKLRLIGFIMQEIVVKPASLYFKGFIKEQSLKKKLYLLKGRGKEFNILKIETDSNYVDFSEPVSVSRLGMDAYMIEVSLKPNIPVGKVRSKLRVYTDSSEQPIVAIPIIADVEGEFVIEPTSVFFTHNCKECPRVKTVEIFSKSDEKLEITRIENTLKEYISVNVEPVEKKEIFKMVVALNENIPSENIQGKINLFANGGKQPIIEISVSIYNKKSKKE